MGYIDEVVAQSRILTPAGGQLGLPRGAAYASYYPTWETQTPQYQQPNAYAVAQETFRQNEFVYSLIIKRAMAEAKGHFRVNDNTGAEPNEIKGHDLTKLIRRPNKNMTENDFWGIKRISQDIAGFAAFEIEYNLLGEPMRLWFMRPDWCSFIRAQQDPLAFIRYQPYGMDPMDIPLVDKDGRQRVLFFSNAEDFDILYPGVRFFSPAMHALPQVTVDNAMTFFLADFVRHGAKFAGVISVAQTIDDNISNDLQRRWQEKHGGTGQWSNPLILGLGSTFSSMQMNFNDMAFPELDGRTESRICNTFQMDVIVADARVGQNISSYNNKKEAVRDWYFGWVADTWETNAEIMNTQMLPLYESKPDNFLCDFDVSKVYAMQEDRTARWTRAVNAWKARLVTLNVALKEAALDPVKGKEGESYYEAVSLKPAQNVNALGEVAQGQAAGAAGGKPAALPAPAGDKLDTQPGEEEPAQASAKALEAKAFRTFAAKRIKEGKAHQVASFEFKHHAPDEAQVLLLQAGIIPGAAQVLEAIGAALEKVGAE